MASDSLTTSKVGQPSDLQAPHTTSHRQRWRAAVKVAKSRVASCSPHAELQDSPAIRTSSGDVMYWVKDPALIKCLRDPIILGWGLSLSIINKNSSPSYFFPTNRPIMAVTWDRLVRYVAEGDGTVRYGEPIIDVDQDIGGLAAAERLRVKVLEGSDIFSVQAGSKVETVGTLLGPLTVEDVPIIRCIGLNYKTHSKPKSPHVP